ncbi:hypothetical protein H6S82_29650 [Planktothrix sp. FACHB-1355]|uniref:Uncharacterized protein n=1 Tax=Aerosakkonema funiforme FACHB-1375 TaxID=2949571 RepID=A0A926VIG4_9CYAN|nr:MULTISPECIES: hypothetical protein [Oscillatoriales]MBD2184414.1 hypothetical protein [Aerosakkonema funiforme FACHB-1375]MBD3562975.1 hypothetical protein [Planktothrix sp. FACHB-1355]
MQNIFENAKKLMAMFLVTSLVVTTNIINFPDPAWAEVSTIINESSNNCNLSKSCIGEITTVNAESFTTNPTEQTNAIKIEEQKNGSNLSTVPEAVVDGLFLTAGIILGIILAPLIIVPLILATNDEKAEYTTDKTINDNSDSHNTTNYNCYAFSNCSSK